MKNNFFNFPSENSKIKIALTVNYFKNWLSENKNEQSLSYIDFFSGPGIYETGYKSTPILIMEEILKHPKTAQKYICKIISLSIWRSNKNQPLSSVPNESRKK